MKFLSRTRKPEMLHIDHPINEFANALGTSGQLIDVREPKEVAQGTLPGAKNIPVGDMGERFSELDKANRVVVFCRSGGRSSAAAQFLTAAGFSDVVNLEGGMLAYNPNH